MVKYTPQEYRLYLQNSKKKHILVEGKNDKYLIERLWGDFANKFGNSEIKDLVVVDSAEYFIKADSRTGSNKEKIVEICQSINGKSYANRFIGFVDRDLDKFDWDREKTETIKDNLQGHEIEGRMVRSRGHSIENYLFETACLCESLELISTITYAGKAIKLFESVFESAIYSACIIGLAAAKSNLLKKIQSTISWELIELGRRSVIFLLEDWLQKLASERNLSPEEIKNLSANYEVYSNYVSRASFSVIRWLCHGHTGYDFLRETYIKCVREACPQNKDPNKEISNVNWMKKDRMFEQLTNFWVKTALDKSGEYPREVFELLDLC
jgi:hypothetical protein